MLPDRCGIPVRLWRERRGARATRLSIMKGPTILSPSEAPGVHRMAEKASKIGTEARNVKPDVRRRVLHEAGCKCGNPNCFTPYLELHHLIYVSEDGEDEAYNLLPLCVVSHTRHHKGEIPTEALRAWKLVLITINEAFDRRSTELLLVLESLGSIEGITGDGLPTYAPLVASGMARVRLTVHKADLTHNVFRNQYKVWLTDKGRAFVEGWKAGDQRAALGLLPTPATSDDNTPSPP